MAQHPDYWTQDPGGMTGLGPISKVLPESTSCLHWAGGPNPWPETATFSLNIVPENLHDCDTRHYWDWNLSQYKTEVIDTAPAWLPIWGTNVGEINSNGVYYAPTTTNDSVNIWCTVWDAGTYIDHYDEAGNPILAFASGAAGEYLYREWGGMLKIYKVGVRIQPANVDYWEDSTDTEKLWTAYNNLSALLCQTATTYTGVTNSIVASTGWSFECSWTTITQPSGCDIVRHIYYGPKIVANGVLDIKAWGDGIDNFPVVSTILIALSGAAGNITGDPYVKAFGSVVESLGQQGSDANAGIAMDSVIKYLGHAGSAGDEKMQHFVGSSPTHLLQKNVNVSCLNVAGVAAYKTGFVTEGSVSVATEVDIMDQNVTMYHGAEIVDGGSAQTYLKYGATLPLYGY